MLRILAGLSFLLAAPNVLAQECDVKTPCADPNHCCSKWGWCGVTESFCGVGCQNGPCTLAGTNCGNGKCGPNENCASCPADCGVCVGDCGPTAGGLACTGGECCSEYGWCGSSADHCGVGCQVGFGTCPGITATPSPSPAVVLPSPSTTPSRFAGPVSPTPTPTVTVSANAPLSHNGRCGANFGGSICPHPLSCSQWDWCSQVPVDTFVQSGCQPDYGYCVPQQCGNGYCENSWATSGETCANCPLDCGPCQSSSIKTVCKEQKEVALTFDDGPYGEVTERLLDILARLNIKAGFFVTGTNGVAGSDLYPETLKRAFNEGHHISSHSYSHPNLNSISLKKVSEEFFKLDLAVRSHICIRPRIFRQPFGQANEKVLKLLKDMGMRSALWSVDSLDWQLAETNSQQVLSEVAAGIAEVNPFGILHLQHDLLMESVNLVEQIVDLYLAADYKIVSLPRCLWGANYESHPTYVFEMEQCAAQATNAGRRLRSSSNVWNTAEGCPTTSWGAWGRCDTECGIGTQTRVRYTMPMGLEQRSAECALIPLIETRRCAGRHVECSPTAEYSDWSEWSPCSKECHGGTRTSTRTLLVPPLEPNTQCERLMQTEVCNTEPCVSGVAMEEEVGEEEEDIAQAV